MGTEVEDELETYGATRISKKNRPKIDKKNLSFMCVQNVDNISLDGNKNGQANERGRKRTSVSEICKN